MPTAASPRSIALGFLLLHLPALPGLALGGCTGSASPSAARSSGGESDGDDDDELTLGDWELPARPHDIHFDEGVLADGASLAEETMGDARPPLDGDATAAEMHEWVEGPLRQWLLRRAHGIRDARAALAPAEDGEDAEHIVAAAIVGVLYADLAWQIAEIAIPRAVRGDELGALAMRNALLEMSSPLFDQALSAFGACASSAVGSADPTVERWARFCDDESERLVEAPRPIAESDRDDGEPDGDDAESDDDDE